MEVKFWGVRGSIPVPAEASDNVWKLRKILASALTAWPGGVPSAGQVSEKFIGDFVEQLPPALIRPVGGNTPCVEVRHGDSLIVLDAGSGLRQLGLALDQAAASSVSLNDQYLAFEEGYQLAEYRRDQTGLESLDIRLLMSHTHWDHLQGFPFFAPAYKASTSIAVYGRSAQDLSAAFERQQTAPSMFPVALGDMGAKISFHSFPAEGLSLGGLRVTAFPLPHPGGSLAYRLSAEGRSAVYATDYEFPSIDSPEAGDFVEFIKNADLFISDTQYTWLEGAAREGWGHSTSFGAVDLAMRGGVSAFYMFHHDPGHSDAWLFEHLEKIRAYHAMLSGRERMAIELAVEGAAVKV